MGMKLKADISPIILMMCSSHLVSSQLRLALVLFMASGVVLAARELAENVIFSQPEVPRLSPVQFGTSLWSSRQQPTRLVGVVEPGRLLNIFLGIILIMGFAVLNSFLYIAIGITGSLPPRFTRPKRGRPPRDVNAGVPQFSEHVFHALHKNQQRYSMVPNEPLSYS
jgi:hypothetical protein